MICPNCGSENQDGAKFCESCGSPLNYPQPENQASQSNAYTQPPQNNAFNQPQNQGYTNPEYQGSVNNQPYGNPNPGYNPTQAGLPKGMAVAALVLGIIGLCCLPSGIVALILGLVQMGKCNRGEGDGKGMAVAGVVLGVISIVCSIITIILELAGVIDPSSLTDTY